VSGFFRDMTTGALEKALDAAGLRQRVAAHNIANINTPGYKRSYVAFEDELKAALGMEKSLGLRKTHPGHLGRDRSLATIRPRVEKDDSPGMRADGNNVDIDAEMAELAINTLMYSAAATRLNSKLSLLRYVINEGRR
jgi:flagellar basal-body rod protein FlgB